MARDDADIQVPHPREANDLIGHRRAERGIVDAWTRGRIGHAWLITGDRGIGKATFAYRVAKFVLAGGAAPGGLFGGAPETLDVDPDHPAARRIVHGAHPDLRVLERGLDDRGRLRSEILVGDVRAFTGFFAMTAADDGWRVGIVDAADELNRNAANALLKTLEEPPPRSILLLVAHAPGRVAATIRSRCRRIALERLAEDDTARVIERHRPDLTDEERLTLARLAEGAPGRALGLAAAGGLDLYRDMATLLERLDRPDIPALHDVADRLARPDATEAFRLFAQLLCEWIARMIRAAASGEGDAIEVIPDERALMARFAARRRLEDWCEVWEKVQQLFAAAESANLDRKQVLITVFSNLERTVRA
jgi:DNA polymerase-3 subunit delta'